MHAVNEQENIVEVHDVSFLYGTTPVLSHISLAVHRGDYLAIVGGNGAGKTTLLKIMLGLLPASTGSVKLFGTELSAFVRWDKIGYVPQQATRFDAYFPATVREVVAMGRFGKRGLFRRLNEHDHDAVKRAMDLVGVSHLALRPIGMLSGGEQQRVFIARALAGEPEVVFLDEPTVSVEKEVKEEFYALLRRLNDDLHLTVVLVTHDLETMAHEAMHVACIDCTLFFHDSAKEFLKQTDVTHSHTV